MWFERITAGLLRAVGLVTKGKPKYAGDLAGAAAAGEPAAAEADKKTN